jgi:hypothetical protein
MKPGFALCSAASIVAAMIAVHGCKSRPMGHPGASELAGSSHAQDPSGTAEALDRRLAFETIDPAWSPNAISQIREAIALHATGSHLIAAECRLSLCRVVVSHESAEAQEGIGYALARERPFLGGGTLYRYDRDPAHRGTTLYVIREGKTIADLI